MPRKSRPLNREGRVRDATLIIIASEDTYGVKQYFDRFRTTRVQFEVLETKDCRSAPQHVMQRIDDFRKEHVTVDGDTFWLSIDRDRWDEQSLMEVLRQCRTKGYSVALSNPCFELWLLLHYEEYTHAAPTGTAGVNARLSEILSGYSKQCCRLISLTSSMVETAKERARSLDVDHDALLNSEPSTRIYRILDHMLARDAIVLA